MGHRMGHLIIGGSLDEHLDCEEQREEDVGPLEHQPAAGKRWGGVRAWMAVVSDTGRSLDYVK